MLQPRGAPPSTTTPLSSPAGNEPDQVKRWRPPLDLGRLVWTRRAAECVRARVVCQADMGGMGFIQSNHSRILFNSTMISFNVRRP